MISVSKIVIVILTLLSDAETLVFNNTIISREDKSLVKKLFLALGQSYSVCFWANQLSNDLSNRVFKLGFEKNITFTTETNSSYFTHGCDTFVLVNFLSSSVCSLFLNNGAVFLSLDYKIIIMNSSFHYDFEQIEHCVSNFESANVTVLTLNQETFILSSPLLSPRRFTSSSNLSSYLNPSFNKLHGILINVATFHYPPFTVITHNGHSVEHSGMEMNLWKAVAGYLNCTWKVVDLDKGFEWGFVLDNGTLVGGITEALEQGAADVAFCNIWQRSLYLKSMDFGPLMNKMSLTFLVRRPHQISDRFHNLVGIFQAEVWLTTLAALLAVSFAHWCASSLGASVSSKKRSMGESLLVMFGILTVSSSHVRSPTPTTRVIVVWWFVFALLFTTAITSTIITRLTVPLYSPRIDSFRQLVEGGYYWTLSTYQGHSLSQKEFYFDLNNTWQVQFESRWRLVAPTDLEEQVKTDEKLVIPAQRWGSEYVVMNIPGVKRTTDLQRYRVMRTSSRDAFTSFGFRKRSPYNELFTRTIYSFVERGLWSYWRTHTDQDVRKHLLVERDIASNALNQPQLLTMSKMYPVFLLLFFGNVFVCVVFVVEFFYKD